MAFWGAVLCEMSPKKPESPQNRNSFHVNGMAYNRLPVATVLNWFKFDRQFFKTS